MKENTLLPLELPDGFSVESVFYDSGTLCISTQAGCRMGCPFCASGRAGLKRNLTIGELHAQVALHSKSDVKRITLSGIGEPLDNFDVVSQFIKESELPVSVTTSVPDTDLLKDLLKLKHNGVMLSVHSGTQTVHKRLIPKSVDIDEIFTSLKSIWGELSANKRKKVGFNYILFDGINDTEDELSEFIDRVTDFKESTVHLLVCNDVENSKFRSPDVCRFTDFYERMYERGLNVRRANSWRKSTNGGCGTLYLKSLQK